LPSALAIVNPNRSECGSQLGHLCGAGVAFYLSLALKGKLREAGFEIEAFNPKSLLDCLAIGTLTDMVPLTDENRVLVKHGLIQLENTQRPGLKALMRSLGLVGRPLTCQDVAIRFAPKLNALSRMELGIMPIDILLENDHGEAERLVEKVLLQNETRKTLQARAESDGFEQHRLSGNQKFAWVYSKSFHKGVIGLVATKLAQEFMIPSFVGSQTEDGKIVGSCRLPPQSNSSVLLPLSSAEPILNRFGGHAAAAGFEMNSEKAEDFQSILFDYFEKSQELAHVSDEYRFDVEGSLRELDEEFMRWYESLRPFGAGFPVPRIRLNKIVIKSVQELRGGHRKFKLADAIFTYKSIDGICFAPLTKSISQTLEFKVEGKQLDIIAEPQWNYFAGRKTMQLIIHDFII
jgi:single-stranded-DNA-specific exonuclease